MIVKCVKLKEDKNAAFNESFRLLRRGTGSAVGSASDIEKHPKKYAHACDGKKLATCFYEPSTRTRLSFEAAMLNLVVLF